MAAKIREIALDDLENLTETLLNQIRSSHFEPDVVVYLETGARLLASHFLRLTGVQAIPLTIQRSGNRSKARIAFLLRIFPRVIKNGLRRIERRVGSQGSNKRTLAPAPEVDLSGKRVLILDDAADSGQSLLIAKQWVLQRGAVAREIRVAVVTVTQSRAKEIVDFWIYDQLCRFPWSSDSREREKYLRFYEQSDPTRATLGHL
jgi:hypoxanthine phosphoribosyltransferase